MSLENVVEMGCPQLRLYLGSGGMGVSWRIGMMRGEFLDFSHSIHSMRVQNRNDSCVLLGFG